MMRQASIRILFLALFGEMERFKYKNCTNKGIDHNKDILIIEYEDGTDQILNQQATTDLNH